MAFDPSDIAELRLTTLAQLTQNGAWALELVHARPYAMLLWITRGQGLALLDGARCGVGAHNAIFIPAGQLMSMDLGRQTYGQAVLVPPGSGLVLPDSLLHLRVREVGAQNELTVLFESMGREQTADRPLCQSALQAYGALMGVWLRRQILTSAVEPPRPSAARRLVRAYFARLSDHYADGGSMADHAAALDVTPTHLTRVCRAETGKTAAALLTERQLHAARVLLTGTDVPVQDIARHLGFGSAAYFTRFIQQHFGQPPTRLRRAAHPRS
ncbi:AraC family transcriptional regulator [Seohaeicola saemankumensis]|nr:AraC family transcriptional regulator [Seohaeicola saemankumensis]MCA0872072.1 AraC family transcriptional regulator [Seohaeicola saemankumensis]